jgi:hypothetical protein
MLRSGIVVAVGLIGEAVAGGLAVARQFGALAVGGVAVSMATLRGQEMAESCDRKFSSGPSPQ